MYYSVAREGRCCTNPQNILVVSCSRNVLQIVVTHEKINGHRELTVTTVVTAPGPSDHGSVRARRGHSSVTARSQLSHGEVTAQSRHLQYDHGSVTARSQLNHGPGHGSVTAGCDHFGHRELTVSSHGGQFFSHGKYSDMEYSTRHEVSTVCQARLSSTGDRLYLVIV